MKNTALFDETNRATYCPEDDKLRLYVGRVPRDEYEALRAEGTNVETILFRISKNLA